MWRIVLRVKVNSVREYYICHVAVNNYEFEDVIDIEFEDWCLRVRVTRVYIRWRIEGVYCLFTSWFSKTGLTLPLYALFTSTGCYVFAGAETAGTLRDILTSRISLLTCQAQDHGAIPYVWPTYFTWLAWAGLHVYLVWAFFMWLNPQFWCEHFLCGSTHIFGVSIFYVAQPTSLVWAFFMWLNPRLWF
jgi:hypothetical protein